MISMNDVFHTPISYLEHPKLDELYLTRVNRGFHYGDKELAKNIDFVGRNRDEIVQTLGARLKSSTLGESGLVIEILKAITGREFGFGTRIPVVQQQAAINKWKE